VHAGTLRHNTLHRPPIQRPKKTAGLENALQPEDLPGPQGMVNHVLFFSQQLIQLAASRLESALQHQNYSHSSQHFTQHIHHCHCCALQRGLNPGQHCQN
jgi:hypothetical protein